MTPYAADIGADLTAGLAVGTGTVSLINNRPVLVCPQATDTGGVWTLVAPVGVNAPHQIVISYMMQSAVAGNVRLGARIEAVTDSDPVDLDATISFAASSVVSETVPTTAGCLGQAVVTVADYDALAASDYVRVIVYRNGTDGTNDTASAALYLLAVEWRDSNPTIPGGAATTMGGYTASQYAQLNQNANFATIIGTQAYISTTPFGTPFAYSSAGWKKVGYWSGSGGRGHVRVSIINSGGNRAPFVLTIDATSGWSFSVGDGTLFCYGGSAAITGVRITTDGTYKYLEVNSFYAATFLNSLSYRHEIGGYYNGTFTLYTGEVNSPGTDTVVVEVATGLGAVSASGKLLVVDGAGSGIDADLLDGQEGAYYLPAASYTAADIKAKTLTIDGAGSTIDADLLDGVQGSGYVLTTAYDPADVLAKVVTVDGTGTGLDADTVDGAHIVAPTAFTPVVAFGGASVSVAYTTRVARYQKIGKLVYYSIYITLSSKGTSVGALTITGLPFASANVTNFHQRQYVLVDLAAGEYCISANIAPNTSLVAFLKCTESTGAIANITNTDITNTHSIQVTGCYESAT